MSAAAGTAISDAWKAQLAECLASCKADRETCAKTWRAEGSPAPGVTAYSIETPGTPLRKFLAVGDVPGTVEQLSALLYNTSQRMTWDASYVGIDVVEPSYGGLPEAITEANMVRLRLKRLLTISPRDFLIVQCKSTDAAGGITSVAFSVEDSRCPADKDYVRGEVMSGTVWHVEPSPTGTGVRLYYGIHSDLKGWIPTAVVNAAVTTTLGDYYKNLRTALGKDPALGTAAAAKTTA